MKILKSKKALSPVVASIILIAVTVAVSIAVAAWMGALTFSFMGTESLGITTVQWSGDNTQVEVNVTNTGTKDVTIKQININYAKMDTVSPALPMQLATTDDPVTFTVTFAYVNGSAYDISIVTSSGYEFTDHFTGGEDAD